MILMLKCFKDEQKGHERTPEMADSASMHSGLDTH